jgi:hypothetical protein
LSLLCASLAWLENERVNNRPLAGLGGPVNPYPSGPDADIKALLNGSSAASLQGDKSEMFYQISSFLKRWTKLSLIFFDRFNMDWW